MGVGGILPIKTVKGPLLCHVDGKRAHGPPREIFFRKDEGMVQDQRSALGTLFGFFNESTEEGAFLSNYTTADPFSLRGWVSTVVMNRSPAPYVP